ncbi:MAG: iron-sulfur cluster insertion protein ErpA [Alphaproteobacteria bacterium]
MDLQLSDSAVRQLTSLTAGKDQPLRLRITVLGGGCSGFQYKFCLDAENSAEDQIFAKDGAEIIIDSVSLELVQGAIVDYVDDMAASMFVLKNPNATASCGCGNSFSL